MKKHFNQILIFKYCADEETFQNVLNEFPERYAMGVSAPLLNLSADKETVEEKEEKNKRHPSLLYMFGRNKICPKRNVDSWCEYSVIFVSFPFFFYHFLNVTPVIWLHASLLVHLLLQVKLL